MENKIYTAKYICRKLQAYYLWDRHYKFFTEEMDFGGYRADCVTMDNNGFLIEIEIKRIFSDLLSELNSIEAVLFDGQHCGSKFSKHLNYLKPDQRYFEKYLFPSKFYYCFPDNFLKKAEEILAKTPYGIILITDTGIKTVKMAKKLHNKPLDTKEYLRIIQKLTFQNYYLQQNYENSLH